MNMSQVQAYQGYFHAGQFIPDNRRVRIPENRRVIVNVLDEEVIGDIEAFDADVLAKKAKAIKSLEGIIPADFEFNLDDIRRERIEKRGLV